MIFREDALAGKRVLVTGATSGLGQNAAAMLVKAGAAVTLVGRSEERLSETLSSLQGSGHRGVAADISSIEGAYDLLVGLARENGSFDGVFHAAGIAAIRLAKMINSDHHHAVFGAAVDGAFGIAKACGKKAVLNDGGSVVFMASVAGQRGKAGMVVYSAAKAALGGMTRSLAAELAPRGIRVNEIVAGAVETPMHADIVKNLDDQATEAYRNMHMLGFGKPEDVSAMAVFLLSDAAGWITGASFAVDGGYTAQ